MVGASYFDCYSRNIGILTGEEQSRLYDSHVTVFGTGGAGGLQAYLLARLGIGHLTLVDTGCFDLSDMNRQFGATAGRMGSWKADVVAEELADIAPFCDIVSHRIFPSGASLRELVEASDIVVDAIDVTSHDAKVELSRIARAANRYVVSAPAPDFGAVLLVFSPTGLTYEDITKPTGRIPWQAPSEVDTGQTGYYLSSNSTIVSSVALGAAMLVNEVALHLIGRRNPANSVAVPQFLHCDLLACKMVRGRLAVEGR